MPRNDRDRDDRRRDRDDDRDDRRGSARDRDDDRGGRDRDRDRDDRRATGSRRDDDRDDDRGGGGSSRYQYRGRSDEEVSRRANQSSGRYDSYLTKDVTTFKARVGENTVRIIGWLNGADPEYDKMAEKYGTHWGVDGKIHRNVGVDDGTYLCLKMFGEDCPICNLYQEDGDDKLKISDRIFCWVVDRDNEKAGVQFWNLPLGSSKDISAISKVRGRGSDAGAAVMIDHPEEGYDLIFDREGEKTRTRFKNFALVRESSPLSENQRRMDDWLGYVADNRIPDLFKRYDVDYIEKVLSGQTSKRERADDDERGGRDRDRGSSRRDERDNEREDGSDRRRGSAREDDDRDDRRRDRDDDRDTSRSSRRGDPEEDGDTRPSRRDRGSDTDDAERDSGDRRGNTRDRDRDDARGSRGGRDRDDDGGRETRRGRGSDDDDKGGKTERYRGKDKDDDGEGVDEARARLGNVGRRRRGDD